MLYDEDDNPPARFGPIDPVIWVAVVPWIIVAIMMTISGMALAGIPLALIVAGIVVLDSWCNRPMPGLERSASQLRSSRYDDDQPSDVREPARRPSPQESRASRPVPGANRPPQRTGAPGQGGRAPAATGDRTAAARTRAVPGDRPAPDRTAAARDRAAGPARPGAAPRQGPPPQQQQRPGAGRPAQQPAAPRRRPPGV